MCIINDCRVMREKFEPDNRYACGAFPLFLIHTKTGQSVSQLACSALCMESIVMTYNEFIALSTAFLAFTRPLPV